MDEIDRRFTIKNEVASNQETVTLTEVRTKERMQSAPDILPGSYKHNSAANGDGRSTKPKIALKPPGFKFGKARCITTLSGKNGRSVPPVPKTQMPLRSNSHNITKSEISNQMERFRESTMDKDCENAHDHSSDVEESAYENVDVVRSKKWHKIPHVPTKFRQMVNRIRNSIRPSEDVEDPEDQDHYLDMTGQKVGGDSSKGSQASLQSDGEEEQDYYNVSIPVEENTPPTTGAGSPGGATDHKENYYNMRFPQSTPADAEDDDLYYNDLADGEEPYIVPAGDNTHDGNDSDNSSEGYENPNQARSVFGNKMVAARPHAYEEALDFVDDGKNNTTKGKPH